MQDDTGPNDPELDDPELDDEELDEAGLEETALDQTTAGGGGSHISYDCSPWAGETRRLLVGMLEGAGVPHAWEGTVLVVRDEHEEVVDELVDQVVATTVRALDPDADTVSFPMAEHGVGTQNDLLTALAAEGLPHEWDMEGDLVVHEEDAERVEELLDELLGDLEDADDDDAELDDGEELDGLELHDRLGALFVAADRLVGDPDDRGAGLDLLDADESLEGVGVPFGVERAEWAELRDASAELVDALRRAAVGAEAEPVGSEDADDIGEPDDLGPEGSEDPVGAVLDGVGERARRLRELLRRFV